jgi:cell wall assembly regulator SMI1
MNPATPLEELEVSVRTAAFLGALQAKTLGELLAMPTIEAPARVAEELRLLFADEGIEYAGTIASPVVNTVKATGDLAGRWATITAWLHEHQPATLGTFLAGAAPESIAALEAELGVALPEDYRTFLRLHDGQSSGGPMVWTCSLHPVSAIVEAWREQLGLAEEFGDNFDPSEVAPGVRPVQFSPKWIPIGTSARGRDILSLDLDPAEGGAIGQVILTAVDSDAHQVIAPSFTELLSVYFEGLQTGDVAPEGEDSDAEEE